MQSRHGKLICIAVAAAGVMTLPAEAHAGTHGHVVHRHGPNGGGYSAGRVVSRSPGEVDVRRRAITHNGNGTAKARHTEWSDGNVQNQVSRTYRNGQSSQRTSNATRNGDGSAKVSRSRTGAQGNQQSSWSTIYRTDDGYTRTRNASTSNGRGYSSTRDVSVSDDYVTVNRDATTANGRTTTTSRTYPRPN